MTYSVSNNSPLTSLNNTRKNTQSRRRTVIRVQNTIGTLLPVSNRGINRLLHIRSIEIDRSTFRQICLRARETKDIPQLRASGCHLIDIPARIEPEDLVVDCVEDVAVIGCSAIYICAGEFNGERPWRWESQVLLKVSCVAAGVGHVVQEGAVAVVEGVETGPVVDELHGWDLLLNGV